MSVNGGRSPLEGQLVTVPFSSVEYLSVVCDAYERLVADHGPDRVLVLNRYPSGTAELEDAMATAVQTTERPRIYTLSSHAERVLREGESMPEIVGRDERLILVRDFLTDVEWETPYLRRVAEQEGFHADFLRFLVTASYQQRPTTVGEPALEELYDAVDAFHEYCRTDLPERHDLDTGFLDRSNVIVTALEILADPEAAARVRSDFDAVLALEFEEFDPTSRAYVGRLTEDCELVGVAREESALRRPWSEPGSIERQVPAMDRQRGGSDRITDPLQALSVFLATGRTFDGEVDLSRCARLIEADTFSGHIRMIGREIKRLNRSKRVSYDDFVVMVRDSSAPIERTNDVLRAQGLPTTSATVRGFEHDQASREILALARWVAAEDARVSDGSTGTDWESDHIDADTAYDTLVARVARGGDETAASATVDRALAAAADAPDVHAGLARWIVRSGLKERIASESDPLQARVRFDHVTQLIELAKFLSRDAIAGDWARFVRELEEKFESAAVDHVAEELDTIGGAVRVDVARTLKDVDADYVFLVGVVEGEYPFEPNFGTLFPRARLRTFDAYPTVTAPTAVDVEETFARARDGRGANDPLGSYYSELSRRILGIGTRVANERVYFGTYEQERELGRRCRPSRFIDEIEAEFGTLERVSTARDPEIDREAFALTRLETAVDRLQQGAVRNEPVDVEAIEREFGVVRQLLDERSETDGNGEPDALRRAIETQRDLFRGRVRRE